MNDTAYLIIHLEKQKDLSLKPVHVGIYSCSANSLTHSFREVVLDIINIKDSNYHIAAQQLRRVMASDIARLGKKGFFAHYVNLMAKQEQDEIFELKEEYEASHQDELKEEYETSYNE
jgi:hypothetical protein